MQGYDIGAFNHEWKYLGNGLYECTLDEIVVTASRKGFMEQSMPGLMPLAFSLMSLIY